MPPGIFWNVCGLNRSSSNRNAWTKKSIFQPSKVWHKGMLPPFMTLQEWNAQFFGGQRKTKTVLAIDLDYRRYESHMYVPLCWCQLLSTFNLCWQRTCTYRWWFHGFFWHLYDLGGGSWFNFDLCRFCIHGWNHQLPSLKLYPLKKGPCQTEISSPSHWFSGTSCYFQGVQSQFQTCYKYITLP